jgi:hypothetical protein
MAALAVLAAGATAAAVIGWRWKRSRPGQGARTRAGQTPFAALVWVAILTLAAVVATLSFLDTTRTVALSLSSDVIALAGLAVLAIPAWLVLRARDPRRLVLATLGAAVLWLLIWYPNLSGLPLPSDLAYLYQGLLPTWNWDFQFAVNSDPALEGPVIALDTLVVGLVGVGAVSMAAIAARRLRRAAGGEAPSAAGGAALPGMPGP